MIYKENKIYTTSQGVEPISALLLSHGIEDIIIDDLDNDIEPSVIFYTGDSKKDIELFNKIKIDIMKLKSDEQYGLFGKDADFGRMYIDSKVLDDEWKDKWKKDIHPFAITKNIVIKPSWEDYEPKAGEQIIEIDPGMAFGTGRHETTSSCAILLEKNVDENDTVIDIGTGSGILAMIAKLNKAKKVDAYDIDPDAIMVATANLKRNNNESGINLIEGDILSLNIKEEYDVVVANLISEIIIKMLPTVKNIVKSQGIMILSGMLTEEQEKMENVFAEQGLKIVDEIIDGEWYTVSLEKPEKGEFKMFNGFNACRL